MKTRYALCIVLALMILVTACSEAESSPESAASSQQAPPQPIAAAKVEANQLPANQAKMVGQFLGEQYLTRIPGMFYSQSSSFVDQKVDFELAKCYLNVASKTSSGISTNTGGISMVGQRWPMITIRSYEVEEMTATHAIFRIRFKPGLANAYFVRVEVTGRFDGAIHKDGIHWIYNDPPYLATLVSCERAG